MSGSLIGLALVLGTAAAAPAQITVDGTLDVGYPAALAVQQVQTQFGDSQPSGMGTLNAGSELDAAYATVMGGRLYLMLTGNLEDNFNKLEIFFDSRAGGENVLSGTPEYDYNGNPSDPNSTYNSQNMAGFTFDSGFAADFHLIARAGSGVFDIDFIDRNGGTTAAVPGNMTSTPLNGTAAETVPDRLDPPSINAAGTLTPDDGTDDLGLDDPLKRGNISGPALSHDLQFAFDNANIAGVSGGTEAADQTAALAVTTGLEFSIALVDLGINPTVGGQIKVSAFVNNGDHNYASNQFLGALQPPQGNLGGDGSGGFNGSLGGVDLNSFAGDQFFTIDVAALIPGDADGDGDVDGDDFNAWGGNFPTASGATLAQGDFDFDGDVDGDDFNVWGGNFPYPAPAPGIASAVSDVPEPASIGLIGLGGLALLRRRR